jgi:hypothetical protein
LNAGKRIAQGISIVAMGIVCVSREKSFDAFDSGSLRSDPNPVCALLRARSFKTSHANSEENIA